MQPGEEVSHWERGWEGKVKGERQVSCSSLRGRAFCENAQKGAKLIFYVSPSRKDRSVLCVQEGLFLSQPSSPPLLSISIRYAKRDPFSVKCGIRQVWSKDGRISLPEHNSILARREGNEFLKCSVRVLLFLTFKR